MAVDPYDLKDLMDQMQGDLIRSMKKTLKSHKREEEKEGFRWEQWQQAKLRNLILFRVESQKTIEAANRKAREMAEELILSNFTKGYGVTFPESREGAGLDEEPPQENNFFAINKRKVEALIKTVQNDLDKASQATLRKTNDIYRQVIYKASMNVAMGAKTLNKAVDMALKEFIENGIMSVTYKDGRQVSIVYYAEMAIRTASQRATFMGEGARRDETGNRLIFVSSHNNTCKLCLPWQARILIDDVFAHGTEADGEYPLLSEAMKAGLLHPNCRHTIATYYPDVTVLPRKFNDKEVLENYAKEQKQRALEREIRKWKRIKAAATDSDTIGEANRKIKYYQKAMREHLEENDFLRRNPRREKILA